MDQVTSSTPAMPSAPAPQDTSGKVALSISVITLLLVLGGLWHISRRFDRLTMEVRAPQASAPIVPLPPIPVPAAPTALEAAPTPPSQVTEEKWYTVTSLSVGTKKGAIKIRHECNQVPEGVAFDGANYKGTVCFGTNRLLLVDATGKERMILPARVLPTDEDGKSLAPFLFSALSQDFSNGKQDVLISFDADTCSSTGNCGAGQPTPRITFVYSVDEDRAFPITPVGDRQTVFWGGDRRAILVDLTCGGAGCDNPQAIRGFNLNTNTIKTLTTLKADWNEGQPTGDTGIGRATAHWESVKWVSATNAEAVYVGADGMKQTIPLNF